MSLSKPTSILRAAAILTTGTAALLAIRSLAGLSAGGATTDAFVAEVVLRLVAITLAVGSLVLCAVPRLGILALAGERSRIEAPAGRADQDALRPAPASPTI